MIILTAKEADASAICTVHKRSVRKKSYRSYSCEQIEAWIGARRPDQYAWAMREGGETMWVACSNQRLVGFASLKGSELMAVYTTPEAPKRTGTALLKAVEQEAKIRGTGSLETTAFLNAESFCERNGFKRIRDIELPLDGVPALRVVLMIKSLGFDIIDHG